MMVETISFPVTEVTKHRKNDVSDRLIAGNAIAFVAFPGFDERQFFYRIGEEVGVGGS